MPFLILFNGTVLLSALRQQVVARVVITPMLWVGGGTVAFAVGGMLKHCSVFFGISIKVGEEAVEYFSAYSGGRPASSEILELFLVYSLSCRLPAAALARPLGNGGECAVAFN
jgi:hypothetical protein